MANYAPDYFLKAVRKRNGKQVYEVVGLGWKQSKSGVHASFILQTMPIPFLNDQGEIEVRLILTDYSRGKGGASDNA